MAVAHAVAHTCWNGFQRKSYRLRRRLDRIRRLQLSGGPDGDCSNAYAWRPVDARANGRDGRSQSYLPDDEVAFARR